MDGKDIMASNTTTEFKGDLVCANITESGTYFAAMAVEDYSTQESLSQSMIIQSRVGAAIYFIVALFALIQWIVLFVKRKKLALANPKLIFVAIVFLNSVIRGTYLLLPTNAFENGYEALKFVIFEFPSFLFFTVYSAVIYLWINVVNFARFMGNKRKIKLATKKMTLLTVLINGIMYLVFVIFILLVAFSSQLESQLPCYLGNSSASGDLVIYRIRLAYWIFLSIICFAVSIAFLISFIFLMKPFLETQKRRRFDIVLISVVATLCTVCMLIRSALFLYSAVTRKSIGPIAFVILEALPSIGLLYYLRPFGKAAFRSTSSVTRSVEMKESSKGSSKST